MPVGSLGSGRRRREGREPRPRFEPKPAAGGRVYHVYPADYMGPKQEPAFTGLMAAYYTGSSHSDNFNTYPPRVEPGDTILVHAGLYKDDRFRYGGGGPGGTAPSGGTYYLTQSGTPEKPIVIQRRGGWRNHLRPPVSASPDEGRSQTALAPCHVTDGWCQAGARIPDSVARW